MTAFTPEKTIKKGCWTTVEKGVYEGRPTVRKQYVPEQRARYEAEVNNLTVMATTGFAHFVGATLTDDEQLSLLYTYVPGLNGEDALRELDSKAILRKLFAAMITEAASIGTVDYDFSFTSEGHKTADDPFAYTRLLQDRTDLLKPKTAEKIGKLTGATPTLQWGRYDPEFSNFIVAEDGVIYTIDYENMMHQDPLFPFAYSLVHMALEDQTEQPVSLEDGIQLAREASVGTLCASADFDQRILLNFTEVCGYLALETELAIRASASTTGREKMDASIQLLEDLLAA